MIISCTEREEKEREEREKLEAEKREYEARLAKLEEQAEKQRQREREIEEKEAKRRQEVDKSRSVRGRGERGAHMYSKGSMSTYLHALHEQHQVCREQSPSCNKYRMS